MRLAYLQSHASCHLFALLTKQTMFISLISSALLFFELFNGILKSFCSDTNNFFNLWLFSFWKFPVPNMILLFSSNLPSSVSDLGKCGHLCGSILVLILHILDHSGLPGNRCSFCSHWLLQQKTLLWQLCSNSCHVCPCLLHSPNITWLPHISCFGSKLEELHFSPWFFSTANVWRSLPCVSYVRVKPSERHFILRDGLSRSSGKKEWCMSCT